MQLKGWQNENWTSGLQPVKGAVVDHQPTLQELPDDIDSCTFVKFSNTYYQVNTQYNTRTIQYISHRKAMIL